MIKAIKRLFKKDYQVRNIYHPDIRDKVQYSFTCKGVKYYSFIDDHKMLTGRYFVSGIFFKEQEQNLTFKTLKEYLELILKDANKGDLAKVAIKINELLTRIDLPCEEETLYKVASAMYFNDSESLDSYDHFINARKIEDWKESRQLDFFFTKPFSDYINLSTFSENDLPDYLNQMTDQSERLKKLMHEL